MLKKLIQKLCRHKFGAMFELHKKYGLNWELGHECAKCGQLQYRYLGRGYETLADPLDPKNESKWTRRPIKMEPIWYDIKS